MKNTVIFNYIPHKIPKYSKYNIWYNTYYNNLIDLYSITVEILNKRYYNDNKLSKNDEKDFNNFCKLIYNSSSKHIHNF